MIKYKGAIYHKASSESLLNHLIPQSVLFDIEDALDETGDKQLSSMFRDVLSELRKRLEVDATTHDALRRIQFVMQHYKDASPDLIRNNLGKALNALGLKTPISF